MPTFNLGKVVGEDGRTPNVQIGTVATLGAGESAYFTRQAGSPDISPVFDVGIPRGTNGVSPNIQIGTTVTVASGEPAEVTRREGSPDAAPIFDFKLPQGEQGEQGIAPAGTVLITASTTLDASHANKLLIVNSANDITIIIPTAASVDMGQDTEIEIFRAGTGAVSISAQSGVTILCASEALGIADRYASVALKLLTALDATKNTWSLQGALG